MPHVKANGVSLHYELRGPAGAPVIVFSHSIGATLDMWDAQIAAFAGRYQCLRYDTRGHGSSEVVDRPARVDDLADDMAGLLDALGIAKAHVVGLSLGGMTAQAFALRHADRLERLVLIATTARMDPIFWQERAALVRREGYGSFIETVLTPRWFTPDFARRSPETIATFRERFPKDWRGYAVCCGVIETLDLPERIGAIQPPTLIMVGADDPATPVAMSEDLRNRIPESELLILPRLAHLLVVERPDLVNPYLAAFLERDRTEITARAGSASFAAGLANRKAVLGAEHVERSLAAAGAFGMPWQDFITRLAWGEIWGDPTLAWKTRSLVTLAMMTALHREEEFKLHLRAALRNGVTVDELGALIRHSAVYAGVPAGNAAMRWAREVLGGRREVSRGMLWLHAPPRFVIPAQAGITTPASGPGIAVKVQSREPWIPAFARSNRSVWTRQESLLSGSIGVCGRGRSPSCRDDEECVETWQESVVFPGSALMAEFLSLADASPHTSHDGDTVAMEGFTHLIPFAAGHEVIRQTQARPHARAHDARSHLRSAHRHGLRAQARLLVGRQSRRGIAAPPARRGRERLAASARDRGAQPRRHGRRLRRRRSGTALRHPPRLRGLDLPKVQPEHPLGRLPLHRRGARGRAGDPPRRRDHPRAARRPRGQRADRGHRRRAEGGRARRAALHRHGRGDRRRSRRADPNSSSCRTGRSRRRRGARRRAPSYAHGYYGRDNAFYMAWDAIARERDTFLAWMQRARARPDVDGFRDRRSQRRLDA